MSLMANSDGIALFKMHGSGRESSARVVVEQTPSRNRAGLWVV